MPVTATAMNLAGFAHYVTSLSPIIKRQYDRSVNRDLSKQNWQSLFQRNIIAALQQVYAESLEQLRHMTFDRENIAGTDRSISVNEQILNPLLILMDELIQYALQKHRTSCALSNFPEEHTPSQAYIAQVMKVVDSDWSVFVSKVKAMLLR